MIDIKMFCQECAKEIKSQFAASCIDCISKRTNIKEDVLFEEWLNSLSIEDKEFFDGLEEYVEIGFKAAIKIMKNRIKE